MKIKTINIFSFPYLNDGLHYYISIYDIGLLYLSLMGFIISLIFIIPKTKREKSCINCRFNKGEYCICGTYYFEKYGKNEVCYNGELWKKI